MGEAMAEGERSASASASAAASASASMGEKRGEGEKKALDECLAGAGYNVRPSELRQVAQKLEQLEMALDATQGAGGAHLSKDAVHYNPSDLGTWIDSMLHELSTPRAGSSSASDGRQRLAPLSENEEVHGFELAEAAGFLVEDQNVGGLFGLLEANDDEDDGEASLFHEIQGPQLQEEAREEEDDRACEFFQQKDSLPRSRAREFQQPYPQQGTQSSSCSSESTDENCRPRKFPRLEQSPSLSVQGIEPQTLQPQQDITSIEDYIQHIDPDSPEKDRGTQPGFNDVEPEVAGSRGGGGGVVFGGGAREECSSGVRLVHALMACADAIQQNNLCLAQDVLKHVKMLAVSTGGAIGKVAMCFSEALVRRIYGFPPHDAMYLKNDSLSELLEFHFYETCPYLKFAHFTANQAILEAFQPHKRVHVIDFSLKQGIQWPALIQALALRPGGAPALRLTGIGPPHPEGKDVLHEVGLKLAQLADSVNVEFDFRGYVAASLSDIKPWMLDVRPEEALAVNSIFQLHGLVFSPDPTLPPVDDVLASVRALNPKIITIVEQEAHHNSPVFAERFTEALHYYSTMFDSLEARRLPPRSYQQLMSEMYLARSICNIVACEGEERVERHETLMQWRLRMHSAGFRPLHLGSNAFKQASMLLTLFSGGNGHRVEENNGCLTLGWHNRPLIAASAWQCS